MSRVLRDAAACDVMNRKPKRKASLRQDDKGPLAGHEKRNGKGSECVFISMSGFPFLFQRKGSQYGSPAYRLNFSFISSIWASVIPAGVKPIAMADM